MWVAITQTLDLPPAASQYVQQQKIKFGRRAGAAIEACGYRMSHPRQHLDHQPEHPHVLCIMLNAQKNPAMECYPTDELNQR